MSANIPSDPTETPVLLHQCIKKLLASYQPVAVKQKSFFINDIHPGLALYADESVVTSLLGSLLYLTARCGRDTCIKITAKAYHDVMLLHIKDTSTFNNYAILSQLQHLQLLAEKIGGFLDVTSKRSKQTTIAFSFINRSNNHLLPDECAGDTVEKETDLVNYRKAS